MQAAVYNGARMVESSRMFVFNRSSPIELYLARIKGSMQTPFPDS